MALGDRAEARVVAIVQARMSSSRLPGKVLADLGPGTTLEVLARRLGDTRSLQAIVLATSTDPSDDPIAASAPRLGLELVRGPLEDVLARYELAAATQNADAAVRITADCPLVDPALVDRLVGMWRESEADYVCNTIEPRTFPKGFDVEVISRSALEAAAERATDPYDRQHVTPFIRERPDEFSQLPLYMRPEVGSLRLTLDTEADLEVLRQTFDKIEPDADLRTVLAAIGFDSEIEISSTPPA
jgi:spore coat polysaccharide biosynthesis protein SpsF (cytidylyltransferase family)